VEDKKLQQEQPSKILIDDIGQDMKSYTIQHSGLRKFTEWLSGIK